VKTERELRKPFARTVLFLGLLGLLSFPCFADVLADCSPDFSTCHIPENVVVDLPFATFAGDVIVLEPDLSAISDVFRIFNDLLDTGAGTGVGDQAFLFSSDDSTPLPSTFSANAVVIVEGPNGIASYTSSGTGITYILGTPEPASWVLVGISLVALAGAARSRSGLRIRNRENRNPAG
jgi:hypothetical protein